MRLRLATFNFENLGVRDDEESPEARARLPGHLKALRGVIRRLEADAVAFQELLDSALLEPLLEGLGYPHVLVGSRGSSPLLTGVFSRHPLQDAQDVAMGMDFSLIDQKTGIEMCVRGAFSRPALQVTWDAPEFSTTLIVVHCKSKIPSFTPNRCEGPGDRWPSLGGAAEGRLATELKRLAQAAQIRKHVDLLLGRNPDARVVVLGDFNDTLESEPLRIVLGDARACASPGLAGAELVACELAVPEDLRFTQIYRGRRETIDHILISRGMLPHFTGARVLNEALRESEENPSRGSFNVGSDHAPVVAEFRV